MPFDQYLTSSPDLGHPKPDLPFTVYTDASETGLGAVITQKTGADSDQVIAYASRTLAKAEVNYSTTEKVPCDGMGLIEIAILSRTIF